jgi:flagellum-specific peptidoglycan hydrolase FlgJ
LTGQQLQFLLRVTPAALQSQREYDIPACVTIAQAILESATAAGWGSSVLFRIANNPFGIKYSHLQRVEQVQKVEAVESVKVTKPLTSSTSSTSSAPSTPGKVERAEKTKPSLEAYGAFDAQTWEIEGGQKKATIAQFQRFPNLNEAFTAHALLLRAPRYRPAFAVRGDWKQFAERLGPKASQLERFRLKCLHIGKRRCRSQTGIIAY